MKVTQNVKHGSCESRNIPTKSKGRPKRQSFQTILGEYIRMVDPLLKDSTDGETSSGLDAAISEVFRGPSYDYLTARGYDVENVVDWTWILTSKNSHQAASRMLVLEADYRVRYGHRSSGVPLFIPIFILSEHHMDSQSFRLLLIYSLHVMGGQPLPSLENLLQTLEPSAESPRVPGRPQILPSMCIIMVVRLIRHARQVWPQALPTIARAYARYMADFDANADERESSDSKLLKTYGPKTARFNLCLHLLSIPSQTHPFRSTFIQQQAQFELLRAMAAHKPVLPLTRKGYQAVVAVQVAHKKTTAERESAQLKAPSWPPWKEEKMGIDAQRGNDGIFSRAMNILSQMKEAGYSPQTWEKTASILAGWDTDGSPTVQTRTFMRRPQPVKHHSRNGRPRDIWIARIRATRTIREAWACFLSYQNNGLPPHHEVHAAMAEKLLYRQLSVKRGFDHSGYALPGDGPEVHPEPSSARDLIYVPSDPPPVDVFVDDMISHGFRPTGQLLGLLLKTAPNFRLGMHYLRWSGMSDAQLQAICTVWSRPFEYQNESQMKAVRSISDQLFGSLIKFLCIPSNVAVRNFSRDIQMANEFPALLEQRQAHGSVVEEGIHEPLVLMPDFKPGPGQSCPPRMLWHALQLTKLRQSHGHSAWTTILFTLGRDRLHKRYPSQTRSIYRMVAWHEILWVSRLMNDYNVELGERGFHTLCVAFGKAARAELEHPGSFDKAVTAMQKAIRGDLLQDADGLDSLDKMVETGLQVLKAEFHRLVLPSSPVSGLAEQSPFIGDNAGNGISVPSGLHVPSFATLHGFVRALGIVGDNEGLLHLLEWMSRSAVPLGEASDEHLNGARMRRQTLVAIRVFLEKLHNEPIGARVASDPQRAYDIVSRTPGWEWPSDTDVEDYLDGPVH